MIGLPSLHHLRWLALVLLAATCTYPPRPPSVEGFIPVAEHVRVFYRVYGTGADTIVVLHGGPGLQMNYLVQNLLPLEPGRTLIYYDQRGRGRSDIVEDTLLFTMANDVADLDSVRAFFHLSRINLLAHHWGAELAAFYAREHPERVQRLLLVSPTYPRTHFLFDAATLPNDTAATNRYSRARAAGEDTVAPKRFCERYWGFRFVPIEVTDPALIRRLAPGICDAPDRALREGERTYRLLYRSAGGLNIQDSLRGLTMPALIIQGDADPYTLEAVDTWARTLPNARRLLLPTPMLFPWIDDHGRFFAAADAFLHGEWPAGSTRPAAAPATVSTMGGAPSPS